MFTLSQQLLSNYVAVLKRADVEQPKFQHQPDRRHCRRRLHDHLRHRDDRRICYHRNAENVSIVGDLVDEGDEQFNGNLSAASISMIGDGQAVGTIFDDDGDEEFKKWF